MPLQGLILIVIFSSFLFWMITNQTIILASNFSYLVTKDVLTKNKVLSIVNTHLVEVVPIHLSKEY